MQLLCVRNATVQTCPASTALTRVQVWLCGPGEGLGCLPLASTLPSGHELVCNSGWGAEEQLERRPRQWDRQVLAGSPVNNPSDNPNVPSDAEMG